MGIAEILTIINGLLGLTFRLYNSISQIKGDTPIPTWDELVDKNKILQSKIDAESLG